MSPLPCPRSSWEDMEGRFRNPRAGYSLLFFTLGTQWVLGSPSHPDLVSCSACFSLVTGKPHCVWGVLLSSQHGSP